MGDLPVESGVQPDGDPRTVSRGSKIQLGFLGIDSLYLVLEYPRTDVFQRWTEGARDLADRRLHAGIPFGDMVLRRGGNGYRLSVWDGDARLYLTDRVNETLESTSVEGQGMGMMLQLGPMWLRQYGDIVSDKTLLENVYAQFKLFGVRDPEAYRLRLNRLDLTVDLLGVDVSGFLMDEWNDNWVGYASKKSFYTSALTGRLEGLSIGSAEGSVRFKVYDKVVEAMGKGTSHFWRSVWGVGPEEEIHVARFEWSVWCYKARVANMRYFPDLTFERFLELLNYVSLKWGRLTVPQPGDENRSRWPNALLWEVLRQTIDDWSIHYDGIARRDYHYRLDLNDRYLHSLAGWLSGFQVRVGLEQDADGPVSLREGLEYLDERGISIPGIHDKALEKWSVASRLAGKRAADESN